jgi:hypothetical protein
MERYKYDGHSNEDINEDKDRDRGGDGEMEMYVDRKIEM